MRCLVNRPEERYASARELRRALEQCAAAGRWSEANAEAWWEANDDVASRVRPPQEPSALTGEQTVVKPVMGRVA